MVLSLSLVSPSAEYHPKRKYTEGKERRKKRRNMEAKEEEEVVKFSAFPFKPYSIQMEFMNALYHSLNQGGDSMLESPTGGDRRNHRKRVIPLVKEDKVKNKKDKFRYSSGKADKKEKESKGICKDFRAVDCEDSPAEKGCQSSQKKIDTADVDDKEFLLEEYESEDEGDLGSVMSKRKATKSIHNSSSEDESNDAEEKEDEKKFKVYFCSRTHSQLS
ncbi:hypothetical protein PIB30_087877 [Stylosanthes scabra]|uniref:Uncharacterized protein n=1 Tax=Stylosanthes scabra TaxID=79078 RepID=A0ABU6RTW9_9FABA|nr:hypothetical protein [Stylosanthes scabra]